MNIESLKQAAAAAALNFVRQRLGAEEALGIGSGSTVRHFIALLGQAWQAQTLRFRGAVSSSEASSRQLADFGIPILDCNAIADLRYYVDGADEINEAGEMIKGGGAALTREKIIAAIAKEFLCIADASKQVAVLGRFPLPIEIIPMARAAIERRLIALGAQPKWREGVVTDNHAHILDAHGLQIAQPKELEREINQWPGVITVGLFAQRGADRLFLAAGQGVEERAFHK